ncbi:phosphotyrosine protein phosphatase [Brevundimonas sp.]|uniref:phosphotyrosine protein phosphatase n=1 Tax=Brevundimonas sp. TaxID=1871086 RepID=UPI00356AAF2B
MFASWPGVETASAGLASDAEEECSAELVEWADIIFVMERAHRAKLQRRFRAQLKRARVICLDIPDDYAFMQPELVALLGRRSVRFSDPAFAHSFAAPQRHALSQDSRRPILYP